MAETEDTHSAVAEPGAESLARVSAETVAETETQQQTQTMTTTRTTDTHNGGARPHRGRNAITATVNSTRSTSDAATEELRERL